MTGSYDYRLVTLSVVMAVCAAYAALDLAGRTTASRGRARFFWLAGGAAAMGLGIWSMHYIGMLAFLLPVPVFYDWPTVLVSLFAAIFASGVALFVVSRHRMEWGHALAGSAIMGSGIATMHYIGMAAMRLPAMHHYDSPLVLLSVVIAIVMSLVALWLSFHLREQAKASWPQKCASALVMGAGVAAMHYTGMAAATFTPSMMPPDLSHAVHISPLGIAGISSVTLLALGLVSISAFVDRRFAAQTSALTESELLKRELENVVDKLKNSEDRLLVLIETIPALAWTSLPDGSNDFSNQRLLEYMGISLEQMQGAGWTTTFHPEDIGEHQDKWRSALATGEPFENEARVRRAADGEYRWFLIRGLPLRDERGNIVKWYGTMTDIEDRKRAEEALRKANADLAHITRVMTMGELAASIAHEINQPLAAVVTNADACMEWLSREPPNLEEARVAVDCIAQDGTRASEVIRHIRAMFTKANPERTTVHVNELIREIGGLMQAEASRNQVALQTELAPDLPATVGDRIQLQQVIVNLVLNGIEAMSAVTDRPRSLVIRSEWQDSNQVLIAVRDSGVGIDAKDFRRIFDAFFTTKAQGMGMGLSICHSIIEAHGGRLWASTNSDYGATVQFTLPADREIAS
ncbi:MAG TPA: MHYT domain-containing protein [Bryobacteraceae bacterium]|nr:MHYT domain-containing protein [Bryobacteraceae bacterium]